VSAGRWRHTALRHFSGALMPVVECDIPRDSVLDPRTIEAAWYRDAWRAPLARPGAPMVDIFFGIFGHHPAWMKLALIVRNRLASWCGLDAPRASAITHPQRKSVYRVGDTIGVWPIF